MNARSESVGLSSERLARIGPAVSKYVGDDKLAGVVTLGMESDGKATLLVETEGHSILVDPFITGNEKAAGKVDIKDLNPDFILLTHAHQDHILDVEPIASQSGATIVSNYEIAMYYQAKGFDVHPIKYKYPLKKI